jgi:hypothetical protein
VQHFLVHEIPNFFCNSYEHVKFTEVATFHPLYVKNTKKIPDMVYRQKHDESLFWCHVI